jgi:hypothetical protein
MNRGSSYERISTVAFPPLHTTFARISLKTHPFFLSPSSASAQRALEWRVTSLEGNFVVWFVYVVIMWCCFLIALEYRKTSTVYCVQWEMPPKTNAELALIMLEVSFKSEILQIVRRDCETYWFYNIVHIIDGYLSQFFIAGLYYQG